MILNPATLKNLITLLVLLFSSFAYTQGGYTIQNFHIDVVLTENGKAHFTETIDVKFSEKRRGIIREIPTIGNFKGHKQSIWLEDLHVANDRFSVTQGADYIIKIGDKNKYITGEKQYIISYTATNGLLNFEDHEEFYWNLFGAKWDTDIKNSTFTITLPKDLEMSEEDYHVFSGRAGESTEYGSITKKGRKISGKGLTTLGKGRALSVGLKFPKTYFFKQETKKTSKGQRTIVEPVSVFSKDKSFPLPIFLGLGFLFSFFNWGRNKKNNPLQERYYPPNEMSPAEVGTYYDYTVHNRDLLSLIPFWGERGLLKVRVDARSKHNEIYLEKQMEIALDAPAHEKYFFENVFASGDIVYVDDLKETMYKETQISKSMLKEEILDKQLYDQEAVRIFHSTPMLIASFLSFIAAAVCIAKFQWIPTGIGFIVLGLILFVTKMSRPKRSEKGQRLHDQLVEFKNTVKAPNDSNLLEISEKDPRYFDKIFPYAVAFGLDKGWLKSFEDIGVKPDWYYYQDGRQFGYGEFSNDFNLKKIQNNIVIPPQASGGSSSFGGSGGGFSGGGFGGGGGSSW